MRQTVQASGEKRHAKHSLAARSPVARKEHLLSGIMPRAARGQKIGKHCQIAKPEVESHTSHRMHHMRGISQ
jgi:hypothetical protein